MASTTARTASPTQSGTVSNCDGYYTVLSSDTCSKIETQFSITFAQLYQWNTAIGNDCQSLWVGYAVCVSSSLTSSTSSNSNTATSATVGTSDMVLSSTAGTSTTTAGSSSPAQSGTVSSCDEYYTVVSGDTCSKIETKFGITFAQLHQWNTAIGNDCQSLWVGYAVCVGVSA